MLQWVDCGVKVFRVDNPHTKPFAFWAWLIDEVHARDRDVLFLAEAFTKRAVMRHLGKLGFSQSYTYFTWKNARWELTEYVTELAYSGEQEYFRPNFFANTPDILHEYLQHGGPAGVRGAARAGGDAQPQLRDLLRLRALRERAGAAGLRGVPALREVRDQAARARRAAAADDRPAQPDPPRAPRAAGALEHHLPRHRQRRADRLRQADARRDHRSAWSTSTPTRASRAWR